MNRDEVSVPIVSVPIVSRRPKHSITAKGCRNPGAGRVIPQSYMARHGVHWFCKQANILETRDREGRYMLWTIAIIILVLWALGLVSSYTLGGLIHILLVLAIVVILFQLLQGRRVG